MEQSPLKPAMQLLILADPSSLHHGQLQSSYWHPEMWRSFCTNTMHWHDEAGAADQMHRHGAKPELHGSSSLDFGARGVCLSWMK